MSERNIHERDDRILGHEGYGLIQAIHGTGKGKTTSALGQAIRCLGAGKRVGMVYFDKGGTDHYSERKILDQLEGIDYWATGRDRIDAVTGQFDFSIQEIDKEEARRGLGIVRELISGGDYDLVVMDEIHSTVDLGMLSFDEVMVVLDERRSQVEMILTGRDPDDRFLAMAHLVSRVGLERHYFYSGVKAREGLDY